MKITISENETDAGITVYLDGNAIGWTDYNYEDELTFKSSVSLTADQMIAVANKLKSIKALEKAKNHDPFSHLNPDMIVDSKAN